MVEYKIEWATDAKSDLYNILEFYVQRNKSASYSNKLRLRVPKIRISNFDFTDLFIRL